MEINKKYLQKYLHSIAIDQISDDYISKGYKVSLEEQIGKYRADIVARKKAETIVIEIKSGKMTPEKKRAIIEIGNYVRAQENYKFVVAIATPPKEKKLEIEGIEDMLLNCFSQELPEELIEISTHIFIDGITDIDLNEIAIKDHSIFIQGDGVINVEMQYGSNSDQRSGDGFESSDSFPFKFKLILKYESDKLVIDEIDKINIDTSSFYE